VGGSTTGVTNSRGEPAPGPIPGHRIELAFPISEFGL
jgi:hypothetical protein